MGEGAKSEIFGNVFCEQYLYNRMALVPYLLFSFCTLLKLYNFLERKNILGQIEKIVVLPVTRPTQCQDQRLIFFFGSETDFSELFRQVVQFRQVVNMKQLTCCHISIAKNK